MFIFYYVYIKISSRIFRLDNSCPLLRPDLQTEPPRLCLPELACYHTIAVNTMLDFRPSLTRRRLVGGSGGETAVSPDFY
jgi:hypothetical protein